MHYNVVINLRELVLKKKHVETVKTANVQAAFQCKKMNWLVNVHKVLYIYMTLVHFTRMHALYFVDWINLNDHDHRAKTCLMMQIKL